MNGHWSGLIAAAYLTAVPLSAEEAGVFVVVENPTDEVLALRVEDEVCGSTAFEGVVDPGSVLTLALCADEHGLAQLLLTNTASGEISQRSAPNGGSLVAP
jgi:hypothetical protein